MKIAIIGGGISGLTAAYHLRRDHEITLLEAGGHIGGHARTVDVELDGRRESVDVGFMVYNDWTYPQFCRLLGDLGIRSRPTIMSFSVRDELSGLEYNGHSLNALFAQRSNLLRPDFYRMLSDVLRFNREAPRLAADCDDAVTVAEFLARGRYSPQFARQYLLPMGAAIWSCPPGLFAEFPVRFVVEFYHNHGLLNFWQRPVWRVIEGGSRRYVERMVATFADRVRLRAAVHAVRRFPRHVEVVVAESSPERFDHVVFACHSDQALRILGRDATPTEREVLGAFPYQRSVAVLHTDQSLLPRMRRAWASWNFNVVADSRHPATVTYNLSLLQGLPSRQPVLLTLNDCQRIAPPCVLQEFEFCHPVFNTRRTAAQARHPELIGRNRTSYCGAYWRNGFHEDGVVSALALVDRLRVAVSEKPARCAPEKALPSP